ncbi:hypothetical protein N7478_011500 [Penicillium angulare]|uniref:uncharacterized protein n=1 Tax=Penicillium angulare TaxID=116970 RepID=UPI0025402308|nr:uncharacterized protein N7478_011500 [Penicillium angulare]KAJ5263895.1 hypothetical protein N7478_011500 [Penicillium angulare]
MSPNKKVTKASTATNLTMGDVKFTQEEVRTLAAAVRFGEIQLNPDEISKKLGITKNAWALRWRRARLKLQNIPLGTADSPPANPGANRGDKIDTMIRENAEMVNDTAEDSEQIDETETA